MIMEERSNIIRQHQPDEEDEETLSLCDLPIYCASPPSKNDNGGLLGCNSSKEDNYTSSPLDRKSDHFEFYNDEWTSAISHPADSILFCGKLIVNKGYKQFSVSENPQKLLEATKRHTEEQSSVLQWNFNSRTSKPHDEKGKCMNKENRSSLMYGPSSNNASMSNGINDHKYDVLAHKITILKPPTRTRWFVLLFRSTRIPTEKEIRETRQRQNKKIISGQSQVVSGKTRGSKSRAIRWWKLIRVLGCSNNLHRADAVIKSSHSCAPLVRE
ncbi:hypothetical protein AgCh_035228 [Apium graveolens]